MKKYILDYSKKFSEIDEIEFFKYSISEMYKYKDKNIEKYLKIELEYLKLFYDLFRLNGNEVDIIFKEFESAFLKELFEVEKEQIKLFLSKLSFENIFFKKKFKIVDFNEFELLIKLSYRNYNADSFLNIEYKKIKIKINSLYDYKYIIEQQNKDCLLILELLKKLELEIREI